MRRELVRDYPDIPVYQTDVCDDMFNLGGLHRKLRQYDESRIWLDMAVKFARELNERQPDLELFQQKLIRIELNLAGLEAARGDCAKAEDAFRQLHEVHPDELSAINSLAWFLATCSVKEHRNADEAIRLAIKCTDSNPEQWSYWNTLGAAYVAAEDWKLAAAACEKSHELFAESSFNFAFLTIIYCQQDQYTEATVWHQKLLAWSINNPIQEGDMQRYREEASKLMEAAAE